MDAAALDELLQAVRDGALHPTEAAQRIRRSLGAAGGDVDAAGEAIARLDHARALRTGHGEVVLGCAKAPDDLVAICHELHAAQGRVLVTQVDAPRIDAVTAAFPEAQVHDRARAITLGPLCDGPGRSGLLILSAGTGDVPVAEEARVTATWMGEAPDVRHDVGVAGLHRLLSQQDALASARVVIVVAGMEGALPSVVAGLVSCPVIAVPTSVGVGLHLEGVVPLLAMLNGCAPGVAVVNVDGGFSAGALAARIQLANTLPKP